MVRVQGPPGPHLGEANDPAALLHDSRPGASLSGLQWVITAVTTVIIAAQPQIFLGVCHRHLASILLGNSYSDLGMELSLPPAAEKATQ